MLSQVMIFLAAAVLLVPLCSRLALGAVLGYLVAGMLIGPAGFSLVSDVETILHVSEFGVVLLLFIIGLELQPSRLWVLRRPVFGLGTAQVTATGAVLAGLGYWFGLGWQAALVAGLGLAMSSTAFVMQTLAEKGQLTTLHGREAFAILLFQDLAVIPLLALLPLLGAGGSGTHPGWQTALKAVAIIVAVVAASRTVIRPLFRIVITFGGREIFTATALLLVIGTSLLMVWAGLSMSLGAFLAGVLLADSEYRHELEAVIEPFKGLLLGLFFMAVGMSANIGLVASQPITVIGLVFLLLTVKAAVLFLISRTIGTAPDPARKLALALAQGGEFAFVLFGLAETYSIFDKSTADLLIVVVTLSMLLSPMLLMLDEKVLAPWLDSKAEPEYDTIVGDEHPVVIAGYGRVGQMISRVLYSRRIPFTALEVSAQQVDFVRKFGSKIYFGDASRIDLLYAAKVGKAKLFVLAIDDIDASLKTAEMVRKHFPHVPIYARARNRFHAYKLMDLGVKAVIRETLFSSLELSRDVLEGLGFPETEATRTVTTFRAFDEKLLLQQYAVYQDETQLIQTSKQATDELRSLFEAAEVEVQHASPQPAPATAGAS